MLSPCCALLYVVCVTLSEMVVNFVVCQEPDMVQPELFIARKSTIGLPSSQRLEIRLLKHGTQNVRGIQGNRDTCH